MTLRRWLLVILVLATLAAGHPPVRAEVPARFPAADRWHADLEHAPLPPRWATVLSIDELPIVCGRLLDGRIPSGCAVRDYRAGVCWIYAETPEADTPRWLVDHELEHCDGRDHDRR